MGIGSAYLEIQTYGATLIGVVVAVGGILGLLFAKTSKGTLISAAVLIIGGAIAITASKVRTTYQENKELA